MPGESPRTKRIVFVCSGNICRSPMAMLLAQTRLETEGIPSMVISAGTLNIQGSPAAPHAVTAMSEIGLDLSGHRSQGFSGSLGQIADHVVVMAPIHQAEILERHPELEPKIQPFWAFASESGRLDEIADPVGQDLDAFRACLRDLEDCVEGWIEHVRHLS